jgi:hypothetical protein
MAGLEPYSSRAVWRLPSAAIGPMEHDMNLFETQRNDWLTLVFHYVSIWPARFSSTLFLKQSINIIEIKLFAITGL